MKYKKKPVIIDAIQWDGTTDTFTHIQKLSSDPSKIVMSGADLYIQTLEGIMRAIPNDYVIRGVKGEVYPCKPDIFMATYERAE